MVSYKVLYKVKKSKVETAKILINEFIDGIRNNEPDTVFYHAFQDPANPSDFLHIMTFKNELAEELHKNSSYCHKFTEELYPLCEKEPIFESIDLLR